jgi:hypothetical protein
VGVWPLASGRRDGVAGDGCYFCTIIRAFVFKEAYGRLRIFASLLSAAGATFLNVYG